MKKVLLSLLCSCFVVPALRADLIWYEGFGYEDGSIVAVGTNSLGVTNWFRHGVNAAEPSDALVRNHKLENAASSGRIDDIHRDLCGADCSYTNAPMLLYASFTINSTNFPDADGGYFAHFYVNATTFQGRLFALKRADSTANTWQLGVSGGAGTASAVFPADLATNIDYQVVVEWDPVTLYALSIWVNPIDSLDPKTTSSDAITPNTVNAFAFRQASGFGNWFCTISNLALATTFEEAATNVWSTNAVAPVIVYQPASRTNFVGDVFALSAVAAGQGLASLTYDWYKNGAPFANPNGNTNALVFFSALETDSGNYQMVATTPHGLSVTSVVASLWVTNPPVPPTISQHPSNTTVFFGQNASLKVVATGVQPISHQWFFADGTAVSGLNFSGEFTDTLMITDVRANNGTTGGYYCDVTNPFGTRHSATGLVSAVAAPTATIGQLRTMVDPVFYLPTNITALWTVTGIVTTHTNITSSGNASFYMQDDTGGINVFFAGASDVRPQAGDSVTVVGPLGQFNSLLELNLTMADPAHGIVTNSSGNPLPAPIVLPLNFTNNPSASNAIRFYQGALVTFTNVYFQQGFSGSANFGSGVNYAVTNAAGETVPVRVDSRIGDIIGKRIPPFGWTVTGPLGYFLSNTDPDRSKGFQLLPTRFEDIVSTKPAMASYVGGHPVITWEAGPNVPYNVWRAADLNGPFEQIASGLVFTTSAGQYTDMTATSTNAYYKITSP